MKFKLLWGDGTVKIIDREDIFDFPDEGNGRGPLSIELIEESETDVND